jgi:hypothetical protein
MQEHKSSNQLPSEKLSVKELEDRFREITCLLYNTSVKLKDLENGVWKYLDKDIVFKDPWQTTKGIKMYKNGAKGFHCAIWFTFHIFQINIQMDRNDSNNKGRCIVDGVMNLQQLKMLLRGYEYPLRTILVYDFKLVEAGKHFLITFHEEMWSFGDMIENLPLGLGRCYDAFRWFMGFFFGLCFWLSCYIVCRVPWSTIGK